ncbi:MAG: hypothetical protein FWG98_06075 [Candidatus Cloacimonetes bacterium]|nr:hypothetical protein [Candidatus Cloacimonadota bacterium]
MNSLIDVIMAFVAGTIVVMTILYSIFQVRQMNYNIETFLTLNQTANNLIDVVDTAFLEPVGLHLRNDEQAVMVATQNEFVYRNRATSNAPVIDEYRIRMLTHNSRNTLVITRNNAEVYNSYPVFFESPSIFTYYDRTNSVTTNPNDVFSIRVDLNLITEAWSNLDDQRIEYPISFWRIFRNVYLSSNPTGPPPEIVELPEAVNRIDWLTLMPFVSVNSTHPQPLDGRARYNMSLNQSLTYIITLSYTPGSTLAQRQATADRRIVTHGTGILYTEGNARVTKISHDDAWFEYRILAKDNGGNELFMRWNM